MKNVFTYRLAGWSGLLIGMLCLFYISSCSRKEPDEARTLKKVTVGITETYLGEAATFTAKQKGFFEAHGLDVTLELNPSGSTSIRELFEGKVDIAHVAETPVVYTMLDSSYIEGGKPPDFQIFGDMIYSHKIQKIIALKDAGIEKAEDLKGKRIGIYEGTQLDYFLDSYLLEHQISKDSLTIIDMDPQTQVQAITQGRVDVVVTWEPYATYISNRLKGQVKYLNTKLTYSTLWLAATLDTFARENPEVLEAYLKSIKQAQTYINDHKDEAQNILSDKTGVPLEVVKSCWNEIDYELSLSERMLTLFEDQANWLQRNLAADSTVENFRAIINPGPMRNVHPEGITIIQ